MTRTRSFQSGRYFSRGSHKNQRTVKTILSAITPMQHFVGSIWKKIPLTKPLPGLKTWVGLKKFRRRGIVFPMWRRRKLCMSIMKHHAMCRTGTEREAMAFKRIYPEAHFSFYDVFRMTLANITSDLWHAFRQQVFWRSASSIFWFRTAQFWGTYQGYRHSLEWNWSLRKTFYYPHGIEKPEKSEQRDIEPIQYNKVP